MAETVFDECIHHCSISSLQVYVSSLGGFYHYLTEVEENQCSALKLQRNYLFGIWSDEVYTIVHRNISSLKRTRNIKGNKHINMSTKARTLLPDAYYGVLYNSDKWSKNIHKNYHMCKCVRQFQEGKQPKYNYANLSVQYSVLWEDFTGSAFDLETNITQR